MEKTYEQMWNIESRKFDCVNDNAVELWMLL